jgi:hypothetical protein
MNSPYIYIPNLLSPFHGRQHRNPARVAAGAPPVSFDDFGTVQLLSNPANALDADLNPCTNGVAIRRIPATGTAAQDLEQSVVGSRPIFNASVAAVNNKPTSSHNNTFLQGATALDTVQPETAFIVAKLNATAANNSIFDNGSGGSPCALQQRSTSVWRITCGTNLDGGTPNTNWNIFAMVCDNTLGRLYINGGTAVLSGTVGVTPFANGFTLGAARTGGGGANVEIAFAIVYDLNLSLANLNGVGNHLASLFAQSWTTVT